MCNLFMGSIYIYICNVYVYIYIYIAATYLYTYMYHFTPADPIYCPHLFVLSFMPEPALLQRVRYIRTDEHIANCG